MTAWWAALVGAALAFIAWRRGQRTFPYVPALALGVVLALLTHRGHGHCIAKGVDIAGMVAEPMGKASGGEGPTPRVETHD